VQTVTASSVTEVQIATETYTDIGLSASITPQFSDSKIVVIASIHMNQRRDNDSVAAGLQLLRGVTVLNTTRIADDRSAGNVRQFEFNVPFAYDDAPAVTTALTYSFQGNCQKITNAGRVDFQVGGNRSTLILMEVRG